MEAFLKGRNVDTKRLKDEKIDEDCIRMMSEDELKLFVPKYGDRLALRSFLIPKTKRKPDGKMSLLEKLRSKLHRKDDDNYENALKHKEEPSTLHIHKNALKNERSIELGLMLFDDERKTYVTVRAKRGGGVRKLKVLKDLKKQQLLEKAKEIFLTNEQFAFGAESDYHCDIMDYKYNSLPDNITVSDIIETTKLQKLRFYLALSLKEEANDDKVASKLENSDDEDYLPDLFNSSADKHKPFKLQSQNLSSCASTSVDPSQSQPTCTPNIIWEESFGEIQFIDQKRNRNTEEENDGLQQEDKCQTNTMHAYKTVSDGLPTNHDSSKTCSSIESINDKNEMSMIQFDASSEELSNPVFKEIGVQEPNSQQYIVEDRFNVDEFLDREESAINTSPRDALNMPITNDTIGKCNITLHRVNILNEMIQQLKTADIIDLLCSFSFINERGADVDGVSRDAYAAFWDSFFLNHTDGEAYRVPVLSPEYGMEEWKAVGRIFITGYQDHRYFPIGLAPVYVIAMVHGENALSSDILKTSFLHYLSTSEKEVVECALKRASYDNDIMLDILDRFQSHGIIKPEETISTILQIAHKALIQEPKYALDAMSSVCGESFRLLLPDVETILTIYDKLQPTITKVIGLLKAFPTTKEESNCFRFLQRFIRRRNKEQLKMLLRILTGSDVVCVDKIDVTFVERQGKGRVPSIHTCGPSLDLPSTYVSFTEFRSEWESLMNGGVLYGDGYCMIFKTCCGE